jgi:hypothetical protein
MMHEREKSARRSAKPRRFDIFFKDQGTVCFSSPLVWCEACFF